MGKQLRRLAALAGLVLAAAVQAQAAGAIAGVAVDADDGRPLVGAIVQLTGPGLDAARTVVSEDGGKFTLDALPPGTYALSVRLDGYQAFARADLEVKEGETVRLGAWLTPEGKEPAEVVVTGSRIRRKDLTSAAPVTIIDRQQIERSGVVGLGEFLQRLPEQVGGLNAQMNNGGTGEVRLNLRGLDSRRTLVLLNGRRMVGGGLGGESIVDLNSIPLAAVERVEVMKDGASAIYGSDAIAGVVNVILKRKFEGTQVSATGGTSSRGDAKSYDLSASTGVSGARGSAFFSVGYQEQRPVMATDRRWSENGLVFDFTNRSTRKAGSFFTPGGSIELLDPAGDCANPGAIANPLLRGVCQQYAASGNPDFVYDRQAHAYRNLTSADLYNFQKDFLLLTPARRLQLFGAGNYELGKEVRAFYEASFVNRRSSLQFAAAPELLFPSPSSVYNDLGTGVVVGKRMVEAGPRRSDLEINTFRLALGLEGEAGAWAGPLARWRWELSYVYGRNTSRMTTHGILRQAGVDAGVGPSYDDGSGPTCGTPGAPVAGCVPLDVMHGPGTFTADQSRLLTFSGISHGEMEQHVLSAGASGAVFTLWANRPVGLATGIELRRESGGFFPDPVSAAGEASEGNQSAVSGGYTTREAYAELSLPLVSQRPLVEDLELTAALRNVRYTSFGSTTTYKLGGRWMPVRDVTVRGTWSTAFRAPSILELYQGNADGYRSGTDPCTDPADPAVRQQCLNEIGFLPNDDGSGQVPVREGGNTRLRPETATTLTLGVVIQPRWVKNLSLTVDYWDIQLEHTVETIGASTILAKCYTGDGSGAGYCGHVHRDPVTGRISQIDDRYTNIGRTRTSGVDLGLADTLPTPAAGTFRLGVDATYLLRYDRTYSDGSTVKGAGNYDLQLLLARWRWNGNVGWQYGPFGLSTEARYVGSLRECGNGVGESAGGSCAAYPQYSRRVRSNIVFDFAGSWERKTGLGTTQVMAGVRNAFDSAPPKVFNGQDNNTDPGYDYVGRYVWARLTQTF